MIDFAIWQQMHSNTYDSITHTQTDWLDNIQIVIVQLWLALDLLYVTTRLLLKHIFGNVIYILIQFLDTHFYLMKYDMKLPHSTQYIAKVYQNLRFIFQWTLICISQKITFHRHNSILKIHISMICTWHIIRNIKHLWHLYRKHHIENNKNFKGQINIVIL